MRQYLSVSVFITRLNWFSSVYLFLRVYLSHFIKTSTNLNLQGRSFFPRFFFTLNLSTELSFIYWNSFSVRFLNDFIFLRTKYCVFLTVYSIKWLVFYYYSLGTLWIIPYMCINWLSCVIKVVYLIVGSTCFMVNRPRSRRCFWTRSSPSSPTSLMARTPVSLPMDPPEQVRPLSLLLCRWYSYLGGVDASGF